ncbi:PREDICTED: uncharacterized protein LOC109469652 [Branchiostoma belcheri]|uniref:Uncharacterized protein LOC109469652 n=1 Tax=Branchiostoma belcheri TaxID=7741 RepID=A0A6P4Z2F2_BRABE|nr:PREDICTED: uncharacterized protein LOC109469652 [Branchiostoma belcheri]
MVSDNNRYGPSLIRYQTQCILCRNTFTEVTNGATGKCFPGVEKLALKGLQYGRISSEKLAPLATSSLISLFLIGAGITEIDNATFKDFGELKNLNMDDNMLGHIPRNWYGVKNYHLVRLSISNNNIASLDPACFRNLEKLESLDLRGNKLREVRSQWFTGLYSLTNLLLSENKIETIPPKAFEFLCRLQFLDLSNNGLVCLHREAVLSVTKPVRVVFSRYSPAVSKVYSLSHDMAWSVVLGRCDSTEQWARFEAVGMVLRITYEPGQDRFVIDWFSTSASAHNVPSGPDPDFCNPPSERFWSGRFTTYSSFILIAENSERQVKSSFPTQCLEAWEQHDGIHLTLRRSSLKVSVMTRRQLGAPRAESLSIVATTRSSQNVDSENTNKERVECFALNHKYKHISSFNVTATKQVDDTRCFLSETTETSTIFNRFSTTHVSNDNRTQASEKQRPHLQQTYHWAHTYRMPLLSNIWVAILLFHANCSRCNS